MSENVFEKESNERSIRNIPLPKSGSGSQVGEKPIKRAKVRRKNRQRNYFSLILAIVALTLLLLYSLLFHRAEIVATGSTSTITLQNEQYVANLTGQSGLRFIRPNTFSKTIDTYREGSREENRETRATGVVTVFNSGTSPKTYIKNTRFQDGNERVYRAFNRFTVPAANGDTPGSTEVLVFADAPGDSFNSESGARYVLPALREQQSPDFDLVYASQSEPIAGGFSGVIRVPTESDIASAERELEDRLSEELLQDFIRQLPADYIVNNDNQLIEISDVTFAQKPDTERGGVVIEARAELDAVVFNKNDFDRFLAEENGQQSGSVLENVDELEISVDSRGFDLTEDEEFTFSITGQPVFVLKPDPQELARAIAGKKASHVRTGLVAGVEDDSIESIDISPFWRRTLPDNPDHIEVTIRE